MEAERIGPQPDRCLHPPTPETAGERRARPLPPLAQPREAVPLQTQQALLVVILIPPTGKQWTRVEKTTDIINAVVTVPSQEQSEARINFADFFFFFCMFPCVLPQENSTPQAVGGEKTRLQAFCLLQINR